MGPGGPCRGGGPRHGLRRRWGRGERGSITRARKACSSRARYRSRSKAGPWVSDTMAPAAGRQWSAPRIWVRKGSWGWGRATVARSSQEQRPGGALTAEVAALPFGPEGVLAGGLGAAAAQGLEQCRADPRLHLEAGKRGSARRRRRADRSERAVHPGGRGGQRPQGAAALGAVRAVPQPPQCGPPSPRRCRRRSPTGPRRPRGPRSARPTRGSAGGLRGTPGRQPGPRRA